MRALHTTALLATIACLSAGPSAQGLADVARRTSAAPQQPATKKYTNDDVETAKPVAPPAVSTETPADASKSESGTAAGSPAPTSAEEVKAAEPEAKTPEYVLARITTLKAQLQNKEKQLRDLQASGDTKSAALVKDQMASLQKELTLHEARVKPRD